eukprot:comp8964_c0_seq1/m.4161 comp8964_c0_seq1/g.4161  ORF comp8964_c0_seq1/g.4161 comp8964_c0_seq1/m.4161 type:complete len:576 (-) comp8964_c0_seq1:513-2240(-)
MFSAASAILPTLAPVAIQAARNALPLAATAVMQRASFNIGIHDIGKVRENEKAKYVRHPWLDGRLPSVPTLSDELRILTFIAGNTAAGNMSNVTLDWCFLSEDSHHKGLETILHNLIFSGIPRTLNSLASVKKIGVAKAAVLDPCTPFYDTPENNSGFKTAGEAHDARVKKGIDIMKSLYGHQYVRMRQKMRMLHPAVDRFITEFVYGRIHSRGVLTQRESQLVTLACMAGQVVVPQFKSNIIQALRAGATVDECRGVLDQTYLIWGTSAQALVDALWSDMNVGGLAKKAAKWREMGTNFQEDKELLPYVWNFDGTGNDECTRLSQAAFEAHSVSMDASKTRPLSQHPHAARFPLRPVDNVNDVVRLLAMLGAHTSAGNLTRVARDWGFLPPQYHRLGMEAMLEALIFAGVHKTVNALEVIHEVGVDKSAIDYFAEDAQKQRFQKDYTLYYKSGCDLLGKIYKTTYDKLRQNLRSVHPDMETLVIEFAYGRVLSRECEGFGARERELMSLACMTRGEIVFPQLHSHMLGALNVGATLNDVRSTLDLTGYLWGAENQAMVDGFWLDFKKKQTKHRK